MKKMEGWIQGETLKCADESVLEQRKRLQSMETRVIPNVSLSYLNFQSAGTARRILGFSMDEKLKD